jgi:hypothetical protein
METAGEGGPWGMALLAAYMGQRNPGETLEDYLQNRVFCNADSTCANPDAAGVAGFQAYLDRYIACLPAQKQAAELK